MERIEGRNWIQRQIIQQELAKRQPQQTQQVEGEPVDPLVPVKRYYYRMYLEAMGQPDAPPESSPIHTSAFNQISVLVESSLIEAQNFYDSHRKKMNNFPPYVQGDIDQHMNLVAAELSHCSEDIIEITVKWMAKDEPLSTSRLGKLIRRLAPSPEERTMEKAKSSCERRINDISNHFLQEITRKYG